MTILDQILADGYATVRLDPQDAAQLAALYEEATAFFARDEDEKLRYSVPNRATGYRPHAYAHAGDPDRPDLNDSFLYWPQEEKTPPNADAIAPFLTAYEKYRQVAAQITADVIDQLRARYGSVDEVPFERASVLQINSFAEPSQEELLQQPHEDGVFLTVIWTSAPGLEAVLGDGLREMYFPPGQVAVMPGGVMTAMTGGEIQPLFHQARNHRILERKSIMYFVSPDADSDITPFVTNEFNRDLDIRQLVVGNPQSYFGLSEDFVTA